MYMVDEFNNIYLTRGDTFVQQVGITKDEEIYVPDSGDVIRFAVKSAKMNSNRSAFVDSSPVITKVIPNDTLILQLDSSDTNSLPFGEYKYDIQITMTDGTVDTFLKGKFTLGWETD